MYSGCASQLVVPCLGLNLVCSMCVGSCTDRSFTRAIAGTSFNKEFADMLLMGFEECR